VLITHSHADHIHGLDDIRIFSTARDMPVYADSACVEDIRERFKYIFNRTQEGGGKPHLELIAVGEPAGKSFLAAGLRIIPIPLMHGELPILGWRIGDTAYLTDCNRIPDESYPLLVGVRNLVIDALRERPHSTHFSFSQALAEIRRINPERAWFTHLCHDFSNESIRRWIAARTASPESGLQGKKIEPAHDGLRITIRQ
jgi:phosphoribosyl 1,2-cyclic phosphate phosphodiesterase